MADENKNKKPDTAAKGDAERVKKLELDIKTAFKEERFEDVKKLAEEISSLDPENHLAERLLEKTKTVEADQLKAVNAGKIKELEAKIKLAFKAGKLPDVKTCCDEIKKLDPENKMVKKIESQIEKAKKTLEAQQKKQKVSLVSTELKALVKGKSWDKAAEKANKLLKLEWGNKVAMKALEAVAKEKKVEVKTLITVEAPKETEKKSGFFARLFKKKEKAPVSTEKKEAKKPEAKAAETKPDKTAEAKAEKVEEKAQKTESEESLPRPEVKTEAKKEAKPGFFAKLFKKKEKVAGAKPAKEVEKPKEAVEKKGKFLVAEKPKTEVKKAEEAKPKTDKDKIKALEADLKKALKERHEPDAKHVMEEIKKLEPENKAIKKAQDQFDKEKAKLEAQAKKEKIKGLANEIKDLLKNEEWAKAVTKANELLEVEWGNSVALNALKKIAKTKKVEYITLMTAQAPAKEEKGGFFAKLFKKKAEEKHIPSPAPSKTEGKVEGPKPQTKGAEEAPKPEIKKGIAPPVTPKAVPAAPPPTAVGAPAPVKPVTPAIKPVQPAAPAKPAPVKAVVPAPVKAMAATPLGAVKAAAAPKPQPAEGEPKGNIFTKLFGKKTAAPGAKKEGAEKPTKSIIDTIVAKTDEGKKAKMKKKVEAGMGEGFLKFATVFLEFSVAFILVSAGFFYVQNIDQENRILVLAGIEDNYASRLHNAAIELEDKEQESKKLNRDIKKYKEGYKNEHEETIGKIVESRMDWSELLQKLNEVTESVYEKNALSQYVKYNNYSYDVGSGRLNVSATLSDPLGKNLTKLAELEEAFMYYPKDKNDPNDEREPYFYGLQEFKSYSKNLDKGTGRYKSNFTLAIFTKKPKN